MFCFDIAVPLLIKNCIPCTVKDYMACLLLQAAVTSIIYVSRVHKTWQLWLLFPLNGHAIPCISRKFIKILKVCLFTCRCFSQLYCCFYAVTYILDDYTHLVYCLCTV